jgi:hypothetical protein
MKQAVKNFNNLLKRTIFKVQDKTNNNLRISNFNKLLITFISLLFLYLFYLLTPLLYDKTWVQNSIESKLLKEFKINLSTSSDISYRILPTPHYLIKDSKILIDDPDKQNSISEIKNLKVFISQKNLFNREKMNLIEMVIDRANFTLLRDNFSMLQNINNKKFSNKKIKINNSNIFFKDNEGETIAIIKISKAFLFFDDNKSLNIVKINGNVFKIPFIFNLDNKIDSSENIKIDINAKSLKLNFFNETNRENKNYIEGKNILSFLNSTINTTYDINEKLVTFKSGNSRINNSKVNYNGKLSINPFDLNLNIDLGNYKISKIFNFNSILIELFKTNLLFNENMSINLSILTNTKSKEEIFKNAKINLSIINGKVNFNKTKLINENIGSLEISNSNLFLDNNKLFLNANIVIKIEDPEELFSTLQTNKKYRKNIKSVLINMTYDFLGNEIEFNKVKIDKKEVNSELLKIIEGFNDNNFNNLNKSRRLLNELFENYEG